MTGIGEISAPASGRPKEIEDFNSSEHTIIPSPHAQSKTRGILGNFWETEPTMQS